MPLRPPDFPPGGLQPLRAPFQRNRHGGVEPVEVLQEIGLGRAGRGEQRVENQRLSIDPQVLALRLQFRDGQPPVHPAAGCSGPTDSRPVDEFVQNLRRLRRFEQPQWRQVIDHRSAGLDQLPEARRRLLDVFVEVYGFVFVPLPRQPVLRIGDPPRPSGSFAGHRPPAPDRDTRRGRC